VFFFFNFFFLFADPEDQISHNEVVKQLALQLGAAGWLLLRLLLRTELLLKQRQYLLLLLLLGVELLRERLLELRL